MKTKKTVYVTLLTILLLFLSSCNVFALSAGYEGINTYTSSSGSCAHGPRAGASYVNNLNSKLTSVSPGFSSSFKYTNNSAWESDITSSRYQNNVDFFAFSGHGLNYSSTDNSMHFFSKNGITNWHNTAQELYDTVNARTTEAAFGGTLKWITVYSCHWLEGNVPTVKLSNVFNTFKGATLTMGYASTMYLDSREGTEYGNNIISNMSFKNAFITATRKYQPQRSGGDTIARVIGYTNAQYDTRASYYSVRPSSLWYSNSPSSYSIILQETIPHNGIPI